MKKVALKNIAKQISSGLTPLRSNPEYWSCKDIPWVKTEQLSEKKIYDTNEKISIKALQETGLKLYPENTLSIAMYGEGKTRGSVAILKSEMTTNQACCNIEINPQKAYYEYVYYYLKTQYNQLRNLSSGVRKNLNSNDIKNFEIRLPENISEQKKIASVLSSLDAKIELNNRINAELEAMAKTLYDYWFVQFDFPNEQGKPYKYSGGKMVYNKELKREIPEGWANGCFNDLGEIIGGSTPSRNNLEFFTQQGIAWITPYDLSKNKGNKFISNGEFDITEEGLKDASLKTLPKGSILLSSRAPIGYMAICRNETTTNQGFKSFIVNKGYPSNFVFYAIKNSIKLIEQNASGSTFKEISASVLKSLPALLPSKGIIKKYSRIVNPIFERQDLLEIENQQLASLRDWLLPMLMNGQVTVGGAGKKMYLPKEEAWNVAAEPGNKIK